VHEIEITLNAGLTPHPFEDADRNAAAPVLPTLPGRQASAYTATQFYWKRLGGVSRDKVRSWALNCA
jgi:hypothetical protein